MIFNKELWIIIVVILCLLVYFAQQEANIILGKKGEDISNYELDRIKSEFGDNESNFYLIKQNCQVRRQLLSDLVDQGFIGSEFSENFLQQNYEQCNLD